MFYANRKRMQNRKAIVFGCSIGLLLTAFGSSALAGDNTGDSAASHTLVGEGSTPTHRSAVDTASGQVYIYIGGSFPAGTHMAAFQYLFDLTDEGNTTGYITPLLFERTPGEATTIYTVVGIGKGFEVSLNSAPHAIPFEVIGGLKVPPNGNFTFGFINALVNSSGVPFETSPGSVDASAVEAGEGVGGTGTTNDWAATATTPYPIATLGTTFSVSGADYTFYSVSRTYSARAIGAIPAQ
jgi:hypothetical protein